MFTGEITKLSTHSVELDPLLLEMYIGCVTFVLFKCQGNWKSVSVWELSFENVLKKEKQNHN